MPASRQAWRSSPKAWAVIARIGVCGQARQRAQPARGFQPVHLGHLHVHQDDVERCRRARSSACEPFACHLDPQAHALQHLAGHLLVDGVVLDQQHAGAGVALAQFVLGIGLEGPGTVGRHARPQPHGEPEAAALAGRAAHAHLPAHHRPPGAA
jgi:hypothetical protein